MTNDKYLLENFKTMILGKSYSLSLDVINLPRRLYIKKSHCVSDRISILYIIYIMYEIIYI